MQDEMFHIPQAQKYCSGNFFHWDSKITTFPGLYLLSAAVFSIVSKFLWKLLGYEIFCTVIFLRLLNVWISFFSFLLYRACRLQVMHSLLAAKHSSDQHGLINVLLILFSTPRSSLMQGTAHLSPYLSFFIQLTSSITSCFTRILLVLSLLSS